MARPAPHPPGRRLDPDGLGDHVDRLYRAAWALCGDRHDAEDLVQETFARVLARPRWLRREDDVGYLLRTLRNQHVSGIRARARGPATASLDHGAELGDPRPSARPAAALEAGELFRAIAGLAPPYREALVAVDVAGLSYREAARALRVKEATLTTRLHRARRQIAAALEVEA